AAAPGAVPTAPPPTPSAAETQTASARTSEPEGAASSQQFRAERMSRDAFVRKATMGRFQQALEAVGGDYGRAPAAGFDVACIPRGKLFTRAKGPRLLGRFVPHVDGPTVAETWARAGQWSGGEEACVFLLGSSLASAGELARAIAEQ